MRLLDSTLECWYDANGDIIEDCDISELSADEEGVIITEYTCEGLDWLLAPARPASEGDAEPETITLYYPAEGEEQGYHVFLDEDHEADGQYCDKARCYDPTQGRWLDSSPLGFDAGDSNLYRYPRQE